MQAGAPRKPSRARFTLSNAVDNTKERKHKCVDQTKKYFGEVVSRLYIDGFYDEETGKMVSTMIEPIRNAMNGMAGRDSSG